MGDVGGPPPPKQYVEMEFVLLCYIIFPSALEENHKYKDYYIYIEYFQVTRP